MLSDHHDSGVPDDVVQRLQIIIIGCIGIKGCQS